MALYSDRNHVRPSLLGLAVVLGLSPLPTSAAGVEVRDAAKVLAGTYNADPSHTAVAARINHLGLSTTTVNFNNVSGSFIYDPAQPQASKLDVTIDMAVLNSGSSERDGRLKSAQFFNVPAFPNVHYVSTSLIPKDSTHATVNGQLTLLGVTKPVALEVTLLGSGTGLAKDTRVGFSATAKIKRSDFGMTAFLPMVGDDVEIIIDSEFSRKPQ